MLKENQVKVKIPSTTNVATCTALHAKINEVKNKINNITNLATTTALTDIENKIPNVSNFVKNLTLIPKLVKLKIKLLLIMIMIRHIATREFNTLTSEHFSASLKQASLSSKSDFANFLKKIQI